ncbi:tRNA lysidine(34) synthetase TilS [Lacticaseibacillus parakribbianus]|uniref:tRNA lysidine(34) synthetase TilS n=1 Tax=Lacticaseibacillus parakribbianus TaxID=2970927 RepID=UPI0021CB79F2|nr:tRNA lysidine(34) synthetase TilS [Lacticaseibacillus parakribbianus]
MLDGEALMAPFGLPAQTPVLLAVSGGVDSMVLMTLLAPLHGNQLQVTVAQFDHQLRPTSAAEQRQVVSYATALGLATVCGAWPQAAQPKRVTEAAARAARYAFLTRAAASVGAKAIVLAHHADDQLETLLFRLLRSGSAQGAAGMRPVQPQGAVTLLRPLLAVPKQALRDYAAAHAVPYAEDASNTDRRFTRNWLRHAIVPSLKERSPQLLAHASRLSVEQAGVLELANRQADALLIRATGPAGVDWRKLNSEPAAVQRVVLERQLAAWQRHADQATLTAMLAALAEAAGTKAFDLTGGRVWVSYATLRRALPEPVAQPSVTLERAEQWYPLPAGRVGRFGQRPPAATAWSLVPAGPLVVRTGQPGDVVLLPSGHTKPLRRLFIDAKVPRPERHARLVAATPAGVVWVQGKAFAELFQVPRTDIIQAVLAFQSPCQRTDDDE